MTRSGCSAWANFSEIAVAVEERMDCKSAFRLHSALAGFSPPVLPVLSSSKGANPKHFAKLVLSKVEGLCINSTEGEVEGLNELKVSLIKQTYLTLRADTGAERSRGEGGSRRGDVL